MEQGTRQVLERTLRSVHFSTPLCFTSACVAGLTALALAGPVFAADPSAQDESTTVHERLIYRDLDLSTRQGWTVLVRGAVAPPRASQAV